MQCVPTWWNDPYTELQWNTMRIEIAQIFVMHLWSPKCGENLIQVCYFLIEGNIIINVWLQFIILLRVVHWLVCVTWETPVLWTRSCSVWVIPHSLPSTSSRTSTYKASTGTIAETLYDLWCGVRHWIITRFWHEPPVVNCLEIMMMEGLNTQCGVQFEMHIELCNLFILLNSSSRSIQSANIPCSAGKTLIIYKQ